MFDKHNFINKEILIYGIGISGKSCLQFLNKNNNVKLFDDNIYLKTKKYKGLFLSLIEIYKKQFDYIVVSPGIDINNCILKRYLIKNKKKIITELDIFYLTHPKNTKITITGTNGKSTTCQMLFNIFNSNKFDTRLVGNIGNSPLLEKKIRKNTIFIIEASSYQISYSKHFKTDHAAILNLSPDHLERHGNITKYARAKLKLIFDQDNNTQSYIAKNDFIINKQIKNKFIQSKINKLIYNKKKFFMQKIKNVYLLDKNNINNIHFVYFICKKFKIPDQRIFNSLNKFKGLKFRKQIIYNKNKLQIINDSKSTSFSSTKGLLSSYRNIYWIVGGKFKKGDKFNLDKKYYQNIKAYIIGKNKNYFIKQFKNKIKFQYFGNLKKVISKIKQDIKNDKNMKTVLFSPAAASFDQFKSFEERGEYFNNIVQEIIVKNI